MRIFHHTDMDGYTAASIVLIGEDKTDTSCCTGINYGPDVAQLFEEVEPGEKVYIVDYSFTDKTSYQLDILVSKGCKVIWLDHHISSLNFIHSGFLYNEIITGEIDTSNSGAYLAYKYFFPDQEVPEYIELVSDYDTFHNKMTPRSSYFKLGYDMLKKNARFEILNELYLESTRGDRDDKGFSTKDYLIDSGRVIKTYIDADNESYLNSYAYESTLDGHKVLVVNKSTNSWIFGNKIHEYPLVCVWASDGKVFHYSIYSDDKVDCSKIAEKFGGGGHPGAAGFSTTTLILHKSN